MKIFNFLRKPDRLDSMTVSEIMEAGERGELTLAEVKRVMDVIGEVPK